MFLMRDEKEERSKQGQTNKQGKATHPKQSLFRAASGGTLTHDTLYSRQSALPATKAAQLAGTKSHIS